MRREILQELETQEGEYISGEQICRKLGISRTAVWKHINELRHDGYRIEATRNKGYRLIDTYAVWNLESLDKQLETSVLGRQVELYRTVGSTNHEAYHFAEKGIPEGVLFLADSQTKGKGRRGRAWHSPPGTGIWMSLVLRPDIPLAYAPQLTLLTAIAVARAIRETTSIPAGIKWPNDILYDSKKLCGILTEMSAEPDQIHFIILGIGINVNQTDDDFPGELKDIASSLRILTGKTIDRTTVLAAVLNHFEPLYRQYIAGGGFATARDAWKELSITLGRQVVCQTGTEETRGVAVDLDEFGILHVREPDGALKKIYSADVLFE